MILILPWILNLVCWWTFTAPVGVLSDSVEEDTCGDTLLNNMEGEEDIEEMTEEQRKAHEEWLEREKEAQEEFRNRKAKEEADKHKKIQEQRRIKEEWNAQQKREQEEKDKKDKELEDVLQQLDKENKTEKKDSWPWHNPEPNRQSASTESNRENCSFFLKTGACRFGERCSRAHNHPAISTTLLFPGMYSSYAIEHSFRDEYDTDIGLEYDEGDAFRNFVEFYEDVLPEFKALGKVVQFKVCCNWEPHLRGNVYVQFATEEDCSKAYTSFNGRFYAGKQLICQYTPVTKWRGAICGTFHYNKCPRGKNCNFLHVFINPNKEFADADRDFGADHRGQRSDNHWSRRSQYSNRGWSRDRGRSRSRDRRYRSRRRSRSRGDRRRSYSRSRSRSRERRDRSRDRNRRYNSRSRSRSRDRRSRSRSRSGSRERRSWRRRRRSRSRSRIRSKSRSRSRSKGRDKKKKKRKHRNHSKEHKHKRSRRKVSNSDSSADSSSDSESDMSDSGVSENKVVSNGSSEKSASNDIGVYPNLAHLIARDYGLLPPTSDASSEPPTPSIGQRSSEPPTPSAAQRLSEGDRSETEVCRKEEKADEKSDEEDAKNLRLKESHSQKKHKHKHRHKSKHKHRKQSPEEVNPVEDD